MQTVSLDNEEWQRVLGIIAQAPWSVANPLLMKIGEQLRQQSPAAAGPRPNGVDAGLADLNLAKPQ